MPIGHMTGVYAFADLADNLPSVLRATVGCGDLYIHLDNVFEATEGWTFEIECDIGGVDSSYSGRPRYAYTPDAADAGDHTWKVHRYFQNREVFPVITKTLRVSAGTSIATRQLCPIGDSTLGDRVINAVMRLNGSGMTVATLGSTSTSGTDSEGGSQSYNHEGHSAWTLNSYIARNDSPFTSVGGTVDFPTWVTANSFASGDVTYWALGPNDMIAVTTDAGADAVISSWHTDLEALIGMSASPPASSLRGAEPGAIVLIDLPIPPAPQEAWEASGDSRWRYCRNIHRLRRALIDTYDNATYQSRNIHIVASHLTVSPEYGWSQAMEAISDVIDPQILRVDDRIHPDSETYYKLGDIGIAAPVLALGG